MLIKPTSLAQDASFRKSKALALTLDFVDFVGLKVKPTNHFTGMLPFGKVRLRLNGSSPAPSLSTISIDVYVDEGGGATW